MVLRSRQGSSECQCPGKNVSRALAPPGRILALFIRDRCLGYQSLAAGTLNGYGRLTDHQQIQLVYGPSVRWMNSFDVRVVCRNIGYRAAGQAMSDLRPGLLMCREDLFDYNRYEDPMGVLRTRTPRGSMTRLEIPYCCDDFARGRRSLDFRHSSRILAAKTLHAPAVSPLSEAQVWSA